MMFYECGKCVYFCAGVGAYLLVQSVREFVDH